MFTNPKLSCQIICACIIVYIVFHLLAASVIHYHSILLEKHQHRVIDRTLEHPLQKIINNHTAKTMTYYEFHSEYYDPYDLYI